MKNKPGDEQNLAEFKSWDNLNEVLMSSNEDHCIKLLDIERKGRARPTFIRRIHSRINKLRADRERKELLNGKNT